MYGPDVIRKYGGLALGDKKLLPIGLANMLRSEKIRWQEEMSDDNSKLGRRMIDDTHG